MQELYTSVPIIQILMRFLSFIYLLTCGILQPFSLPVLLHILLLAAAKELRQYKQEPANFLELQSKCSTS